MLRADSSHLSPFPPADLALVRAVRAWNGSVNQPLTDPEPGLLRWFSPSYRASLLEAHAALGRLTPESAWQVLLSDQTAACRFDPRRVHPSWFIRLFQEESPAVQWVVAEHSPEPIRSLLRLRFAARLRALDPTEGVLRELGRANPEAVVLALSYWTERLVGDVAKSPHDPPVILALTRLKPRALVYLVRAVGQAKQAFGLRTLGPTAADEARARCRPSDRVRVAYFRRIVGVADRRLAARACAEFDAPDASPRRRYEAVGLLTMARLLKVCDSHRARWAVQHLPYPIARLLRQIDRDDQTPGRLPRRAILAWERWIFEAAWARLLAEGRFDTEWHAGKQP